MLELTDFGFWILAYHTRLRQCIKTFFKVLSFILKDYEKYIAIVSRCCRYGYSRGYCRIMESDDTTKEQLFILRRFSLNFLKALGLVVETKDNPAEHLTHSNVVHQCGNGFRQAMIALETR